MALPSKAKTNVEAGLKRIKEKKPGVAVHFLIVRPAGPRDRPRVIFGRKAEQVTPALLKAAYGGDNGLSGDASRWFTVRGVAQLLEENWQILPASRGNKVMDPSSMKVQFKELKVELNAHSMSGMTLEPLIDAAVGRATDTSQIVDAAAGDEEEEEVEEVVGDEEEVEEGPSNELVLEDVPEDVAFTSIKERAQAFAAVDLRAARRLAAEASDDEEREEAHAALETLRDELLQQSKGCRQLLAQVVNPNSVQMARHVSLLKELIARIEAAALWMEEDLNKLIPPNPSIAEVNRLASSDKINQYALSKTWTDDAARHIATADRLKRSLGSPGQILEVGQMLHSRDMADAAIARRRLKELTTVMGELKRLRQFIHNDLTAFRPKMPEARDQLTEVRDAVDGALAGIADLPEQISAAGLALEGQDANRGKRATVRQKIIAELQTRPEVMYQLVKVPGGIKQIDDMVADLQGKAATAGEKAFVKAAIEARFKCKLEGDLTTKALPRMYGLLKMVPESHTTQNAQLGTVVRTKVGTRATGSYKASKLELNVGKTGWGAEERPLGQTGVSSKVNTFDHVTLHELGHAVDDNQDFMDKRHDNVKYGDWHEESAESVAEVVDKHYKLDKEVAFTALVEAERRLLLAHVLKEQESDAETLAGAGWGAIKVHEALKRCRALRKTAKGGQWHPEGAAERVAMGGRVYQEAYAGQWWSYPVDARGTKVSDYQFRAPQEWFAEIYTAYYLKKLQPGGDVFKWFEAEIDL